jgi:sugar diacid utilization regulator
VLDTLLSGGTPAATEQAGLDPSAAHAVVVARLEGEGLRLAADAVARAAGSGAFVVPRHEEVVAVLRLHVRRGPRELAGALTRAAADVLRTRRAALRAGVSTLCADLGEVARGYGEAQQALRHTSAERPAVALEEVGLMQFLATGADRTVRRLVPAPARRLAESDGALVQTVLAYAEADLNVARTAQRLALHPNTVHYRLRRIEELSGLDPRRFADLMELVTAIRVVRR